MLVKNTAPLSQGGAQKSVVHSAPSLQHATPFYRTTYPFRLSRTKTPAVDVLVSTGFGFNQYRCLPLSKLPLKLHPLSDLVCVGTQERLGSLLADGRAGGPGKKIAQAFSCYIDRPFARTTSGQGASPTIKGVTVQPHGICRITGLPIRSCEGGAPRC